MFKKIIVATFLSLGAFVSTAPAHASDVRCSLDWLTRVEYCQPIEGGQAHIAAATPRPAKTAPSCASGIHASSSLISHGKGGGSGASGGRT